MHLRLFVATSRQLSLWHPIPLWVDLRPSRPVESAPRSSHSSNAFEKSLQNFSWRLIEHLAKHFCEGRCAAVPQFLRDDTDGLALLS